MTFRNFWQQFCWPTLTTLCGVAILLALGTWQLQRLSWKQSIVQELNHKIGLPVIDFDTLMQKPLTEIHGAEYQRIQLTGIYAYDHEMKLMAKQYKGQFGYNLLTPMILNSGATVMVDRGWVPSQGDHVINQPQDTQNVIGYLRNQTSTTAFTPANNYHTNELYNVDTAEIARQKDLMTLLPFFVVAEGPIQSQHYPYALGLTLNIRNHHLQYAVIWFTLAFTLAVFYIIYIRKKI